MRNCKVKANRSFLSAAQSCRGCTNIKESGRGKTNRSHPSAAPSRAREMEPRSLPPAAYHRQATTGRRVCARCFEHPLCLVTYSELPPNLPPCPAPSPYTAALSHGGSRYGTLLLTVPWRSNQALAACLEETSLARITTGGVRWAPRSLRPIIYLDCRSVMAIGWDMMASTSSGF